MHTLMCLHTDMCIVYMWSVRLFLLAIVAVVMLYLSVLGGGGGGGGGGTRSAVCIINSKVLQLRCVN